jgi:serine/threonine protein kinase
MKLMIGTRLTGIHGLRVNLIREIGRGGFGVVYFAEGPAGQAYAAKVIAPITDPAVRLSFEQELKSTEGLNHENLLNVIDYGNCPGQQGLFVLTTGNGGGLWCSQSDQCASRN